MLARLSILGLAGLLGSAQDPAAISRKEGALGRHLAGEIRKQTSPLADAVVQRYAAQLGEELAALSKRPDLTWEFTVIQEDGGGSTHEALAVPGGTVFIPAALILAAENEAEFAGMLAHGIAHVAERHGSNAAGTAQVNLMGVPLVFAGGSWMRRGPSVTDDRAMAPRGFLAVMRNAELEADRVAVSILSAAGYEPAALLRYLRRTQRDFPPESKVESMLPGRDERLSVLQTLAAASSAGATQRGVRFPSIQARVSELSARYNVRPPADGAPTLRRNESR
jgi:predicted Zn-dependent protease